MFSIDEPDRESNSDEDRFSNNSDPFQNQMHKYEMRYDEPTHLQSSPIQKDNQNSLEMMLDADKDDKRERTWSESKLTDRILQKQPDMIATSPDKYLTRSVLDSQGTSDDSDKRADKKSSDEYTNSHDENRLDMNDDSLVMSTGAPFAEVAENVYHSNGDTKKF